jgi:NADPH:quinone reductase-like Zn-dependent oxidoreductase
VAIEERNLAALPGDVDFATGAGLTMSGLTVWKGRFEHGRLRAGRRGIAHGAAGVVGPMVTLFAREAGAYVIGTGRVADRPAVLDLGARAFVDLENVGLRDAGRADQVFDVFGGDIAKVSARVGRTGGTLVKIMRPANGLAVDFVARANRSQLSEVVRRFRDRRLRTNIGVAMTVDRGWRRH